MDLYIFANGSDNCEYHTHLFIENDFIYTCTRKISVGKSDDA